MDLLNRLRKDKMSRTAKAIAMVLLGASLLMSGCGGGSKGASGGGSGAKSKNLTIGMTNAPKSFNPLTQPDAAGQFVMRFLYVWLCQESA